jgi:UDP-3-O-[3-hydroxymyristoyl] glucosamine N-acyltransferase
MDVALLDPVAPPVAQPVEPPSPIKIRKKRAPKHDFKDGLGRVFAHKHDNGKGWVADTATVDDTVYIGPRAQIFQQATVKGKVRLLGASKISGHAVVSGGVLLSKNAAIYGAAVVRDTTTLTDDARIFGASHVSGTTHLYSRAYINESAQVFSTTMLGETKISGNALVARSNIHGFAEIKGDCSVIHANIEGRVTVRDRAQIIRSCVRNNHRADVGRDIVISDFAIIADESNLCYPIEVKEHAVIIRSQVYCNHYELQNAQIMQLAGRVVIQHQTFRTRQDLQNYLNLLSQNGGRLGAAQIMPNGQVANFPARQVTFEPPSARRVMRLHGDN